MIELAVGQSVVSSLILATRKWNCTGVSLDAEGIYSLSPTDVEGWKDGWIESTPEGHNATFLLPFRWLRRYREALWLALVGTIDRDLKTCFDLGSGLDKFTPSVSGELCCFANDAPFTYWNNSGSLRLEITRIS